MDSRKQESKGRTAACGRIGYRPYWVLLLSVVLRAFHQVGAAVFLTSYLIEEMSGPPGLYLSLTVVTGIALYVTEAMRHRQIYREVSGLSTALKLVLLGAAYHHYLPEMPIVLMMFVLASLAAHLPREIRHRLVF